MSSEGSSVVSAGAPEASSRMQDAGASLTERAVPGLHESLLARLPPGLSRDARILDVGCGTGAWLARLRSRGFSNLYGIDADIGQVACAGATIARADLNHPDQWPVAGRFDLI